jgi:hypothetical protein
MLATIGPGSSASAVIVLQAQLNLAFPAKKPLSLDGRFGPLTRERTLDFQRANSLAADAVVGPKTWGKLGAVRGAPAPPQWRPACDNGHPGNAGRIALLGFALSGPRDSASSTLSRLVGSTGSGGAGSGGAAAGVATGAGTAAAAAVTIPGVGSVIPLVGSSSEPIARAFYGSSLHYDRIFLSSAVGLSGRAFTAPVPVPPFVIRSLWLLGGMIQVLNVGTSPSRDTLIHELGHAWQSQHHGSQGAAYAANCVACQGAALAANKAIALVDPSVKSNHDFPVDYPISAYAYLRGLTFHEYGGEQIAQQLEKGEAPIISRVTGAAAGARDTENEKSVEATNIRVADRRAPGVFV